MVKVILITAKACPACPFAKQVWSDLRKEHNFEYEEVDAMSEKGKKLVQKFFIEAVPTTIIDDKIAFIGVPDKNKARKMVRGG